MRIGRRSEVEFVFRAAIVLVLAIMSCESRQHRAFWATGRVYEVRLKVIERPGRLPDMPRPATDSLLVRVSVDSVIGDSLFGRYEGSFDSLAVPVGDMGLSPALVSGQALGDAFTLVLAPNVIDAELLFSGTLRDDAGIGTWRRRSPMTYRGTFQLRAAVQ